MKLIVKKFVQLTGWQSLGSLHLKEGGECQTYPCPSLIEYRLESNCSMKLDRVFEQERVHLVKTQCIPSQTK